MPESFKPLNTNEDVPEIQPQDSGLNRRTFLAQFAALTAAGGSLGAFWPKPLSASTGSGQQVELYQQSVRPEALNDPAELTVAEAAFLIRTRRLAPIDLVDAYLDRIEQYDGIYKAFNTVLADLARDQALSLGQHPGRHPLHGIPLAIKDLYYTEGVLTTANSFIYQDFVPGFDATTVAKLKSAGGIVLGKTQMGPLATTRATTPTGEITTVNAWAPLDPSVTPGGSSSGSATAVAARMSTSSIGTQTGGSITSPSNSQGLTGLKPTMGRCSLYGIVPLTYTRDHPGPIARDVKDAAILLQTMAGSDPNDPRTRGLPPVPNLVAAATAVKRGRNVGLRWPTTIGVIAGYTDGTSETAIARSTMLDTFADLGASIVEVDLPAEWSLLTGGAFNNVRLPERTEPFLEFLKQDPRLFGVSINSWINGLFMSGDEYLKGQRAKYRLLKEVLDITFQQCDVVVQTSPVPFDIIGLPEIAFPIGFAPNASGTTLPIGAILGAQPFAEDRLCAVVAAYQAATDYHLQRPPELSTVPTFAARSFGGLRVSPEELESEDSKTPWD
ncbi:MULTISPECIES: amidase [unclassified Thiocapsa]|uniref:amidase n=1 Tax=unclassified Thiocapsa TaxID=2641286 RepID=UPI0035B1C1D5